MYVMSFRSPILMDCGILIDRSYRMFLGQVPYKDFYCITTPLTYMAQALVYKVFSPQVFWMKVYLACQMALLTFLAGHFARCILKVDFRILFAVLPLTLVWLPGFHLMFPWYDVESMSWAFITLVLLGFGFSNRANGWLLFFAGVSSGLSFFGKQNIGGASILAGLVFILFQPYDFKRRLKFLLLYASGTSFFFLIASSYFLYHGAFGEAIEWVFTRSTERMGTGNPFKESVGQVLQIIFRPRNNFLKFVLIFYVWSLVSSWKSRKEVESGGNVEFGVMIYSSLVMGMSVIQDGGLRYPILQIFLGLICGYLLKKNLAGDASLLRSFKRPRFLFLVLSCLLMTSWGFVVRWRQADPLDIKYTLDHPRLKGLNFRKEDYDLVQGLVQFEKTIPKSEKVFIFPDPLFFYFAVDRVSPVPMVPFLEFSWDLKPEEREKIPGYLERENVSWVLIGQEQYYDTGYLRFGLPYDWKTAVREDKAMTTRGDFSVVREYIDKNFHEVPGPKGFWVLKKNKI